MNVEMAWSVAAAIVPALVVAAVVVAFLRRPGPGGDERHEAADAEIATLRHDKAEVERRLAAEAERASRVPVLERELSERNLQVDHLRDARAAVERELATASEALAQTRRAMAEVQARLSAQETETRETKARLDAEGRAKAELEAGLADRGARLTEKTDWADGLRRDLDTERAALEVARADAGGLRTRLAAIEETLEQERKRGEERIALLTEARERMAKEFKVLAEEVMSRHGEAFSRQNKEQVEGILAPLRERLVEFQSNLQAAHTESSKDRATLAEQIRQLTDSSLKMTTETHNLTRALKGKAQTQGAWGEMILSTILERSGLREGEEYVAQQSHAGDDGARLRPDVIVNLPGGQRVVIDSKVSLTAFEAYVNGETEAERKACLIRHLASMRTHIRTLGEKDYQAAAGGGLDYVIMFVPIEGALAAAVGEDPAMTAFAAEANVAIATPTTLMIALRTVANVWHVERRNRNAEAIAERAGKLYDKFVGFLDDMHDLGARLDRARESYDGAMGKLSTGRGNLVRQVEQLKDMGAKTGKSISAALLDDAPAEVRAEPALTAEA